MPNIFDVDVETLVDIIASSDGDLSLAAERLDGRLDQAYGTTKEYELQSRIATMDAQTTDRLSGKFRTMLIIKLYNLVHIATERMHSAIGDLRPSELAKTHASLVNSFATLTAPATKLTFDFESELAEIVKEFPGISVDSLKGELKDMGVKLKAVK